MGYLVHIVLALGAQALVESGVRSSWIAPWAVLLLACVPHALSGLANARFRRGRGRAAATLSRALAFCAPALHFAALALCGWGLALERWLGGELSITAWPRPGLLAVLAPFVVFELLAIDARSRIADPPGPERRAWRGFQTRMFLSSLLPLAAYVLVSSIVRLDDAWLANIEEVALFGGLFALVMLALLAVFLPALLSNAWGTTPIPDGPRRDVLLDVARRAGFKSRSLRVWNTGGLMANAAILGVGPRHRVVLFSDLLLAQLEPRELAAVFAHEIGHAFRRHVRIFVAWAAGFFMAADLVASRMFADSPWISGGFVLGAMLAWYWAFGFLSRRFELEADLYSLDLLGDPGALIGALERVGGAFRDVASWRHFSTAARVRFIERASADPGVGDRLRRELRRWAWIGYALFLVAAALQARSLVESFAKDKIRADLRLGSYAAALARADATSGLDRDLARLVARARSIPGARAETSELESGARAAMRAGDPAATVEWLELGRLRGRADLGAVADALRELAEDGIEPREVLSEELARAWRADIDALRARTPASPPPSPPRSGQ